MLNRAQRVVTTGFLVLLVLLGIVIAAAVFGIDRIRSELAAEARSRETNDLLRTLRLRLMSADSALAAGMASPTPTWEAGYHGAVAGQLGLLDSLARMATDSAQTGQVRELRTAVLADHAEVAGAAATPGGLGRLPRPRYVQPRRMIIALEREEDRRARARERELISGQSASYGMGRHFYLVIWYQFQAYFCPLESRSGVPSGVPL